MVECTPRTGEAPGSIPGRSMHMNKKKICGGLAAVLIVSVFLLFLIGTIDYFAFLLIAGAIGLFAFKVLPKMEN
jgi:dolichol kinase